MLFMTTNYQIDHSRLLTHRINYKCMCLSAYSQRKLTNEHASKFYSYRKITHKALVQYVSYYMIGLFQIKICCTVLCGEKDQNQA